jgi:hypothetical protein
MVTYTCEHCEKKFDHKANYTRHIETHIKNAVMEEISSQNAVDDKQVSCKYCNGKFQNKRGLKVHINQYCKKTPIAKKQDQLMLMHIQLASQYNNLNQKIDALADQNNVTNQKLDTLVEQCSTANQTNIYVNGDVNITIINDFKNSKSIFDSLSNKQLESIANKGGNAITKLVEIKHYNPNLPENHNLLLNKKKGEHAHTFNGISYDEMPIDEIIEFLITTSHQDICKILTNEHVKLDSTQKRNINNLIKKVNEQNKDTREMLREDLIQLMYDNRKMVIETFKNLIQQLKSHEITNTTVIKY